MQHLRYLLASLLFSHAGFYFIIWLKSEGSLFKSFWGTDNVLAIAGYAIVGTMLCFGIGTILAAVCLAKESQKSNRRLFAMLLIGIISGQISGLILYHFNNWLFIVPFSSPHPINDLFGLSFYLLIPSFTGNVAASALGYAIYYFVERRISKAVGDREADIDCYKGDQASHLPPAIAGRERGRHARYR